MHLAGNDSTVERYEPEHCLPPHLHIASTNVITIFRGSCGQSDRWQTKKQQQRGGET